MMFDVAEKKLHWNCGPDNIIVAGVPVGTGGTKTMRIHSKIIWVELKLKEGLRIFFLAL